LAEGFDFNFETFGDEALVKALGTAQQFCAEMADKGPGRWLSLLGAPGVGKTYLAKGMKRFFLTHANRYAISGPGGKVCCTHTGRFWDWRRCSLRMLEGEWDLADAMVEDFFAVIDDIGADYDARGVLAGKLDFILNARLGKWTVLTSNFGVADIMKKLDPRIGSRMVRGRNEVVHIRTEDYALRPGVVHG
jgi:DNA replication protein DnaC